MPQTLPMGPNFTPATGGNLAILNNSREYNNTLGGPDGFVGLWVTKAEGPAGS